MTTALLFGAGGQVGAELLARHPFDAPSRAEVDLADPQAVATAILARQPSVVVNAAAYTAVDRAEAEPELAMAVNYDASAAMADACARLGIPLVHLSTDYVFDGSKNGPYTEAEAPAPLSVYGASKLAGEEAIRARLDTHVILRTAWVFSPRRENFVRTMLRLAEREELRVVDDQRGGPTPAAAVADAVMAVLASGSPTWGTFHFCGAPAVSRFEFARAIFAALGRGPRLVAIGSDAYPLPARRPANSMLDGSRFAAAYGMPAPDWRAALPSIITGDPT